MSGGSEGVTNERRLVAYPSGIYTGTSYGIGTGYISATAQNPDACYRWLSYIAQHVDVFGAMPARLSQINDPTIQASLGDNAGFYAAYAQLLQNPTTIVFPSAGGNSAVSDFLIQFWLNRAFDNYVLHDADLERRTQRRADLRHRLPAVCGGAAARRHQPAASGSAASTRASKTAPPASIRALPTCSPVGELHPSPSTPLHVSGEGQHG